MRKDKFHLSTISLIFFIILASTCIISCGKKTVGPKDIYYRYYNMGDNIVSFQGVLTFQTNDKKEDTAEYSVYFSREKGYDITKRVRGEFIARFTGNDDKLTISKKNGKVTVIEDSAQNRMTAGMPMNLGIDPFYFLETDLEKSQIAEKNGNNLVVTYRADGNTAEAIVTTDGEKITGVSVSLNGISYYRVTYKDYVKVEKKLYFPVTYIHELYGKNNSRKSITASYSIKDIKVSDSL